MNAKDRAEVNELYGQLEEIKSKLETLAEAEQAKFDNMSEGLQQAEGGQKIEEAAGKLADAVSNLESVLSDLDEVKD